MGGEIGTHGKSQGNSAYFCFTQRCLDPFTVLLHLLIMSSPVLEEIQIEILFY